MMLFIYINTERLVKNMLFLRLVLAIVVAALSLLVVITEAYSEPC